jgi:hypothetical protein
MTTDEQLRESYRRLRSAAERVVEASKYPTAEGEEAKVYAHELKALERELRGEPAPSSLYFMSVS